MTEDASAKRPTIDFGGRHIEITEPAPVQAVIAEVITDVRVLGTNICFSLATYVFDGSGPPEARVCARIRVPMETWSSLTTAVMAALAQEAEAKQSAN